ncbi:MAG TPA: DUF1302 domain-containing protein [Nevskiaceae bacterium]|nr:DUF1302 domain-containing protein [Nevskiaceae bacterium]
MNRHSITGRTLSRLALFSLCAGAAGGASAMEFDLGLEDASVRWDNTLRYNLGVRVDERNDKIANYVIADEGTYSFDQGDIVTNRLDLLSELDFVYADRHGVRVSGAAWYDDAYGDDSHSNPNPPFSQIPSYVGNEYSHRVKRYYGGPSGELLDAFAFTAIDLGPVPLSVKAGRHSLYWGESLLLGGLVHSVAYAQAPVDLQKGFATPGAEAKELFRPLANVSAQAQLTDSLSVAAQYFLEYDTFRFPEGGTYLGPVDFLFDAPDRQFVSPLLGFATRGESVEPKDHGEWGVSARWSPRALDGTVGFYARRFADKLPQALVTQVGPGMTRYNLVYADGIELYGISLSKQVFRMSLGAELSYRRDMPLNTAVLGISPSGVPERGETTGARGDTAHAVVNLLGVIAETPVFDAANWAVELNWNTYTKVRSGRNLFNATDHPSCEGKDKWDGCATKQYVGGGFNFSPVWYQVFPDVDLSAPVSVSSGFVGNSSVLLGGNQAAGNYSVGIGADIRQSWRVDLKYVDYFGRIKDDGTAATAQNGLTALLQDRGFIVLTIKTTF